MRPELLPLWSLHLYHLDPPGRGWELEVAHGHNTTKHFTFILSLHFSPLEFRVPSPGWTAWLKCTEAARTSWHTRKPHQRACESQHLEGQYCFPEEMTPKPQWLVYFLYFKPSSGHSPRNQYGCGGSQSRRAGAWKPNLLCDVEQSIYVYFSVPLVRFRLPPEGRPRNSMSGVMLTKSTLWYS